MSTEAIDTTKELGTRNIRSLLWKYALPAVVTQIISGTRRKRTLNPSRLGHHPPHHEHHPCFWVTGGSRSLGTHEHRTWTKRCPLGRKDSGQQRTPHLLLWCPVSDSRIPVHETNPLHVRRLSHHNSIRTGISGHRTSRYVPHYAHLQPIRIDTCFGLRI